MFEAFQFGPVTLWMRTVFLLLAIVMSAEFFFRLARSAGLGLQSIKDLALWHLLSFLFFGRLFAVLANYPVYTKHLFQIFIVTDGAFSFIGGAIGIAIVLFAVTHVQRATFLQWLDVLLPAVTFGLAFDWIGMFLAGVSYGKPTNVFWGVAFDTFHVRYTVPIHPVQLYYALFYFFLTFALLLVRRYSSRAGAETLFGILVMTLGVFFFEFLRGDFGIPVFARLTDFFFLVALFLSLGILALIEHRFSEKVNTIYGSIVAGSTLLYIVTRSWFDLPQFQLRFTQVIAVLALIATVVYVVVHRRKYPHL